MKQLPTRLFNRSSSFLGLENGAFGERRSSLTFFIVVTLYLKERPFKREKCLFSAGMLEMGGRLHLPYPFVSFDSYSV